MNFVADESVDRAIVEQLRLDGHAVVYVAELSAGLSDDLVLAEANFREALLITADKDFGELVYRLGRAHHGIMLLRLAGLSAQAKQSLVSEALKRNAVELAGNFSVVRAGSIRIR